MLSLLNTKYFFRYFFMNNNIFFIKTFLIKLSKQISEIYIELKKSFLQEVETHIPTLFSKGKI